MNIAVIVKSHVRMLFIKWNVKNKCLPLGSVLKFMCVENFSIELEVLFWSNVGARNVLALTVTLYRVLGTKPIDRTHEPMFYKIIFLMIIIVIQIQFTLLLINYSNK